MPTYEYVCRDCGKHLEVVQSFRDAALTTCPACAGSLRKVFGAAGIIFKGSGYYVTDSRKPPPGSQVAGESKDGGNASGQDAADAGSAKKGAGDMAGEAGSSAKSA